MQPEKRTYTIPELDALWTEVESLKRQLAELLGNPAAIRSASIGASTAGNVFVSKKEAAAILSISVSTLEQLIAQGEIKIRYLGKRVMIPREQLDEFKKRDVKIIWPDKRQGKTVRK